jgi:putative membrane protein
MSGHPSESQDPSTTTAGTATDPTHGEAREAALTGTEGLRLGVGGMMMGLANLVPGISGGTMLVAVGVYRTFIEAVANVSRGRLTRRTILTLGIVAAMAIVSIGTFASLIAFSLASFRWGMYSIFIGLTLGGAPLLIRLARPWKLAAWSGLVVGLASMLALVWIQASDPSSGASGNPGGMLMLFLAAVAGASAMILPGVSGAYLLLLLGQYDRIITAVKDFVGAAVKADVPGVMAQMHVLIPVGIGVVVGIVAVSNVLKILLAKAERATLGFLLGLLLAAPAGLYPFQEGVPPKVGESFKGEAVTEANVDSFAAPAYAKDWTLRTFKPEPMQIASSVALVGLGFAMTMALTLLDRKKKQ